MTVPACTWKVALVLPKDSGDDVSRVSASTRTIAVIMPNTQGIRTTDPNDWRAYLTTVDAVETLTHYDLFANVPDAVQKKIEAVIDGIPVAVDQTITLEEDSSLSFRLDVIARDPSSLTYTILSAPSHGAVTGSDVDRTYTPVLDFAGSDSFSYQVCDDTTDPRGSNCATGTVSVNVSPVDDPPVLTLVPSAATTPELTPYTFTAQASDVDSASLSFSLVGAPAGASINPITGQFSWTPTEAQGGTGVPFVFKVQITDGTSNADADIAITVTEVNQAPALVVGTSHSVSLGETLTFVALGSDADIPMQALTYGLSGAVPAGASDQSRHGHLHLDAHGGAVRLDLRLQRHSAGRHQLHLSRDRDQHDRAAPDRARRPGRGSRSCETRPTIAATPRASTT